MAKETLANNNIIEVVGKNSLIKVSSKTEEGGFSNEKKVFTISGRVKKNTPTVIGTITLTAAQNKRFSSAPSAKKNTNTRSNKLNSYLKFKLNKVEKDANKNPTSYVYDLVYTGKENVSKTNKISYNITNKAVTISKKHGARGESGITSITVDQSPLKAGGGIKPITINGTKGSKFKLNITKETYSKDSNYKILSKVESDITPVKLQKGKTLNGKRVIEGVIPSSGKYVLRFPFPKATEETKYWINFIPIDKDIRLSLADWITNRSGWEGVNAGDTFYSKPISQFTNPTLTMRAITTKTNYKINGQDVATTDHDGDGGTAVVQVYDKQYKGRYNKNTASFLPLSKRKFLFTYNLQVLDSAHAFSKLKSFTFSNINSNQSEWTNTIYGFDEYRVNPVAGNGGTIVEVTDITAEVDGTTDDKASITFTLEIIKFGRRDVTMTLNLDTIFNCA